MMLLAITRLFALLVRLSGARLDETRLPVGADKEKVLTAVARARASIPLAVALRVLGLSASRYHAWDRPERACQLDDRSTCPRTTPTQLTPEEVRTMHEMVTAPDHRHMSVHGLALHAQRIGKLFASPGTWGRLIRERGWLRPRTRIHPATPKEGIRATHPNEYWHIDVTVIRLLDGSRVYLHGVIDNFSRRILAWKLAPRTRSADDLHGPHRGSPVAPVGPEPSSSSPTLASRTSTVRSTNSSISGSCAGCSHKSRSPIRTQKLRRSGGP